MGVYDKFQSHKFIFYTQVLLMIKIVEFKLVIQKIHSLYVYNSVWLTATMYCMVLLYIVQLHLHYLMLQQYMNWMLFHDIIYATDCNKHCSYSTESKSLTASDLQADIKIYSTIFQQGKIALKIQELCAFNTKILYN